MFCKSSSSHPPYLPPQGCPDVHNGWQLVSPYEYTPFNCVITPLTAISHHGKAQWTTWAWGVSRLPQTEAELPLLRFILFYILFYFIFCFITMCVFTLGCGCCRRVLEENENGQFAARHRRETSSPCSRKLHSYSTVPMANFCSHPGPGVQSWFRPTPSGRGLVGAVRCCEVAVRLLRGAVPRCPQFDAFSLCAPVPMPMQACTNSAQNLRQAPPQRVLIGRVCFCLAYLRFRICGVLLVQCILRLQRDMYYEGHQPEAPARHAIHC